MMEFEEFICIYKTSIHYLLELHNAKYSVIIMFDLTMLLLVLLDYIFLQSSMTVLVVDKHVYSELDVYVILACLAACNYIRKNHT